MDAFYAAIEERDNPQFSGKPIIVGADPKGGKGRGVVSTASYEARKLGVKSAMPISQAYQLAPHAIFLPPDISKYQRVSEEIYGILKSCVSIVEKASTDEFYLDLSHLGSWGNAVQLAQKIKARIREKENLTSSVGISPNKLIAKIASGINKPDGLTVVKPEEVLDFLSPLDIREIPGIGPKTAEKFYKQKITIIGDLRRLSEGDLVGIVGTFGKDLFNLARGKDERPVGMIQPIQSVGMQVTFEKDINNPGIIIDTVLNLINKIWNESKEKGRVFKTINVIVRYENLETHTSAKTPPTPIDSLDTTKKIALKLLLPFLERGRKIRLVGVRLSLMKG